MVYKRLFIGFLIVISLAIVFVRLNALGADPDDRITWSQAFYNDEGRYAGNAIKKYLEGNWLCDTFNMILVTPVMPVIYYCFFKLCGMSLAAARLPCVLFSFNGDRCHDISRV